MKVERKELRRKVEVSSRKVKPIPRALCNCYYVNLTSFNFYLNASVLGLAMAQYASASGEDGKLLAKRFMFPQKSD